MKLPKRTRQHIATFAIGQNTSSWEIGQAPMVSCTVGGARVTLWCVSVDGHKVRPNDVALLGGATQAKRAARTLAYQAKLSLTPHASGAPLPNHLSIQQIVREGSGLDSSLDGRSGGLAFYLAYTSALLGLRLPTKELPLAAIREKDGVLEAVGGIKEKLSMIRQGFTKIQRVWVAQENVAEAREALVGTTVLVSSAATAEEVARQVFAAPVLSGAQAQRFAARLFGWAMRAHTEEQPWVAISHTAKQVEAGAPDNSDTQRLAKTAAKIAARHVGHHGHLPEIAHRDLLQMPRILRLQVLAQTVQACADASVKMSPSLKAVLRQELPTQKESSAGELEVWGALGRYYAAWEKDTKALRILWRVVEAWASVQEWGAISRPLCEWVRVCGINGERKKLEAALPLIEEVWAATEQQSTSRAYLTLALGRAWVQLGDLPAAKGVLEGRGVRWEHAPPHVHAAALRWIIELEERQGHPQPERRAQLEQLAALYPSAAEFNQSFLDLSDLLHQGAPLTELQARLDRYAADEPVEWARFTALHAGLPPGLAARLLVDRARY